MLRYKRGACFCLAALLLATMLQAVPAGAAIDDDEEDFNLYGGVNDAIALAFDGDDIYVGERHGKLKHFTAPTTAPNGIAYDPKGVVDLSAKVFTRGGHGLTSIAYHDGFVYAVYSTNTPNTVEGCGERYGYPDDTGYPNTPGQFAQDKWASCPTYGQLSRWPVKGDGTFGEEEVVLGATAARWCAEFDAPSITDVFVGPDDAVYVAAADGAHFAYADTGQAHERARGSGERPCRGRGALRAQTDDSLDGKIVRLDEDGPTVVARGLRNPWRHAVLGDKILSVDAGWDRYEEINLFDPTGEVENLRLAVHVPNRSVTTTPATRCARTWT